MIRSADVHCAGMLLLTSNPPQWRMTFTLDDTRYVALVVITSDAPRLTPARQARAGVMWTAPDRR
jgi:hypothetical protein